MLWHLRNDTIHTYRWGDPDFVREVVRNCKQDWSAGYLMGEERTQPGVDDELTDEAKRHQTWTYHHERHWFRFMLWGRLGYDPTVPDSRWIALFEHRYGKAVGKDLFVAMQQASKIIPLVSRFHFNYMNGDWAPEWCAGSWNTGFGRGRNYRDGRDDFHDIIEFIFNHTIDDRILDIPEWVGHRWVANRGGEDLGKNEVPPGAVVRELTEATQAVHRHVANARAAAKLHGEAATLAGDCDALYGLGSYYLFKIVGAELLTAFFATGDHTLRYKAAEALGHATVMWEKLAADGGSPYRRALDGPRSYRAALSRVRREPYVALLAKAAPKELRKLSVLERAKDRPRYDFNNPELRKLIATRLAPATQPLFFLDKAELSPKTCDILVLGREAWGFNGLPKEKKARVLNAVEQGCALVIFFQNFPSFDTSWLPGGVQGRDSDANSFQWTDPEHRVALKLDPKDLDGGAVVNDALAGYDKGWTCLTDPPGGLCVRDHGKGLIVFCQLDVLGRHREPMARRLVHNILRFAARGKAKDEVRLVVLDTSSSSTVQMLKAVNHRYQWLDDLPLAK